MLWLASNSMYKSNPSCHDPCLWTSFDFGMLLQLSATMCTFYLGQSSPGIGHFLAKFGGQLGSQWCLDDKTMCNSHPKLCISTFLMNQCWLWSASIFCSSLQSCLHTIWAKSALELLIFGQKWEVSLAENVVVGLKWNLRFSSQALLSMFVSQYWLWNASTAVCNHARMWFGLE